MRKLRITIGNKSYDVTVEDMTEAGVYQAPAVHAAPRTMPAVPAQPAATPTPAAPRPSGGQGVVISPMAGAIKSVLVKAGDSVTQGQPLIVLEAMKMENQISAPTEGTVKSVDVKEGDSVQESQVLVVLE